MVEVLGEVTLSQKGSFRRVRRYLRGVHPDRGIIITGLTGWETVEEVDVLTPLIVLSANDIIPFTSKITDNPQSLVAAG